MTGTSVRTVWIHFRGFFFLDPIVGEIFLNTNTVRTELKDSRIMTMTTRSNTRPAASVSALTTLIQILLVLQLTDLSTSSTTRTVLLVQGQAVEFCNICPDVDSSGSIRGSSGSIPFPDRVVPNFGNGQQTCSYLQRTVEDVMFKGGPAEESRWCVNNQWLACEAGCCGPPGQSNCFGGNIKDPNPSCDLCEGQEYAFVPAVNSEKTVRTSRFGTQNCKGMYLAASEGIFTANMCPLLQGEAGKSCCSIETPNLPVLDQDLPQFNTDPVPSPTPAPPPVPAPVPVPAPAPVTCGEQAYKETYADKVASWRGSMRSHYMAVGRRRGYVWIDCDTVVSQKNGLCGEELYKEEYPADAAAWPFSMRSHFQLYGKNKGYRWVDC